MAAATEPVVDLHGVMVPTGYEIRRLLPMAGIETIVRALGCYSLQYESMIQPARGTPSHAASMRGKARRVLLDFSGSRPTPYMHSIKSGMSFAAFDKGYQFRRPESVSQGVGGVYWHELDPDDPCLDDEEGEVGRRMLLERLDSGIASLAFAHDAVDPYPDGVMEGFFDYVPQMGVLFKLISRKKSEAEMKSSSSSSRSNPGVGSEDVTVMPKMGNGNNEYPKLEPPPGKTHGQHLARGGTSTLRGYEGKGLMKALAYFLMHEAKTKGFRSIEIGSANEKVHRVWANPPAPYRAKVLFGFDPRVEEVVGEDGNKTVPFRDARLTWASTIVVVLDG